MLAHLALTAKLAATRRTSWMLSAVCFQLQLETQNSNSPHAQLKTLNLKLQTKLQLIYSCLSATIGFDIEAFNVSKPTVTKVMTTMVIIAPLNTQIESGVR
jgi:hypothetical protein